MLVCRHSRAGGNPSSMVSNVLLNSETESYRWIPACAGMTAFRYFSRADS
ncbi:hypothetical protein [Neisseria meningitidis serogroup B]|uniref:PilS cassette n=1 Tax=Neisseria meningitidis serogroup B TaxID=491 RepID=A0A0H5QFE5_NEIMI|nr:hypothetical protein [Neisseria meningitidis serogroup B]